MDCLSRRPHIEPEIRPPVQKRRKAVPMSEHKSGNDSIRSSGNALTAFTGARTANAIGGHSDNFSSYDEKNRAEGANPSTETYGFLIIAYDAINQEFFDGQLPNCMITLQRKGGALGYFSGNQFVDERDGQRTDEIALNPAALAKYPFEEVLSTLGHEMCHLWQYHFSAYEKRRGKMRGYHDKEWAAKMESIGLMPSDTGRPNGLKTGRSVSDYIIEGGPFSVFCEALKDSGFVLHWKEWQEYGAPMPDGIETTGFPPQVQQPSSKTKFTCANCGQNAWAKPSAKIGCLAVGCEGVPMTPT